MKPALPGWFASTVHVPAPVIVSVVPETEQTPALAVEKTTARPEDAVAESVEGGSVVILLGNAPNEIDWFSFATLKLCDTWGAAPKVASPGWLALIVQVPPPTIVTVVPETWHTAVVVVLNITVRPELAVAATVNGGSPNRRSASGSKVIDCELLVTGKLCATWGAEFHVASPPWFAVMVHMPAATRVTVDPDTVQTAVVVEANVTGSPEVAVAETVKGGSVAARLGSGGKSIVWLPLKTVKVCATWGAGLKLALPAWSAVTLQVPVARMVTVEPETEQTLGVVVSKATGRPELAVAERPKGGSPKVRLGSAPKVMVWLDLPTLKLCETCGAAL